MLPKLFSRLALTSALLLTGCGTMSIPTGLNEDKYLDPDGKMIVTTSLTRATFNKDDQQVELDIDQIRLVQLHSVPQYIFHSDLGVTFFLNKSKAKPSDSFKWEPFAINGYSVNGILEEITLLSPRGASFKVPALLAPNRVQLVLDNIVHKLRANVEYTISCERCKPDLSGLQGRYPVLPTPPDVTTEIGFKLNSVEYGAIISRLQQEKAAAAQIERERKQAEQKRQQHLAREEREREAQARKAEADRKREAARIAREGDGSPDDLTCKKYGFKSNTQAYANCRLQVDMARKEMQQEQGRYLAQQQQLKEAQDAERKRRQGAFMLGMGLSMMGGQNSYGGGTSSTYQRPPPPSTRTYTLPNGRIMTCTSSGSNTNCF